MGKNDVCKTCRKIKYEELRRLTENKLISSNLPANQAKIVADCFATADLYGVSTHGVSILPSHIKKIKDGGYNLNPNFSVLRDGGAFAVIDGDNAMGPVSAVHCINYAIEHCKDSGIYTVLSRNNNTFGPAFYYSLLAAEQGLICITLSNSPAAMAPAGGKQKMLGTNPFSISVPCKNNPPIILDMATSIVAKSKINEALKKGEKIPDGWALDENGIPTNDPIEAIKGLIQPMAGFKGYGIAMMIDILSGVLSGAAFLNSVGRFYSDDNKCMNVGYTFIVIDPRQVIGEDFYSIMDEYVETIYNSTPINENATIFIPGDDRLQKKGENIQFGIEISEEVWEILK